MGDRSPGLFDVDARLAEISAKGDGLERVVALVWGASNHAIYDSLRLMDAARAALAAENADLKADWRSPARKPPKTWR